MVIIFPMAGKSQRFRDAGYSEPKYELPLAGQSVFRHAVAGFSHYFQSARFLFVHLEGAGAFVRSECIELGIKEFDLVEISLNTRGQAETVQLGLEAAGVAEREAIAIFNIDTFRPRFRLPPPSFLSSIDGYLEIFRGVARIGLMSCPIRSTRAAHSPLLKKLKSQTFAVPGSTTLRKPATSKNA